METFEEVLQNIFGADNRFRSIESLVNHAKEVLDNNWTDDKFTKPAASLYPHQWSWDSAFVAIGYAHYNQQRAQKELRHLFSGQWSNGMVPQIVFNEKKTTTDYFPGPDFWQTDRSSLAPDHPKTSGICQPPIHTTAVLKLLENADDREQSEHLAEELFPKLKAWHNFLYRERDPNNEGLVYIRHPWASGQDNSPIWDDILERMKLDENELPDYERSDIDSKNRAERPTDFAYDRYVYLLDFFRQRNYDENIIYDDGCPFMVQDVLFNSLLCRSGRDLAQIAEWLGKDPFPFHRQAHKTPHAINNKLWDDENAIYLDYDLVADERIEYHSLSGFLPLFADIPSPIQAEKMFKYLDTGSFSSLNDRCFAIPSYDRNDSEYDAKKYWRGPIWINLNWMLYHGLARYGHKEYNNFIKQSIIYLAAISGFFEHYDPESGEGYGADYFAWSAALFIDVINLEDYDEIL